MSAHCLGSGRTSQKGRMGTRRGQSLGPAGWSRLVFTAPGAGPARRGGSTGALHPGRTKCERPGWSHCPCHWVWGENLPPVLPESLAPDPPQLGNAGLSLRWTPSGCRSSPQGQWKERENSRLSPMPLVPFAPAALPGVVCCHFVGFPLVRVLRGLHSSLRREESVLSEPTLPVHRLVF